MPLWPHAEPTDLAAVLRDAVPTTIADAPDGAVVYLRGTVQPGPGGLIPGPFSGTSCVFFRSWFFPAETGVVTFLSGGEEGGDGYHRVGVQNYASDSPMVLRRAVADTRSDAPFVVADGTGSVLVDTTITQVQSRTVTVDRDNRDEHAGPRGSLVEWIVAPGQPVAVFGTLRRNPDGSRSLVPTPNHVALVSTLLDHIEQQRRHLAALPVGGAPSVGGAGPVGVPAVGSGGTPGHWTPGTAQVPARTINYLALGVAGFVVLLVAVVVVLVVAR